MNLKGLIDGCRDDMDDLAAPYLFSKVRLIRFANEAQNEACRRARLITDSETAEICTASVVIARALITLDPRVIFVRKAKLESKTVKLVKTSLLEMDECPGWETREGQVSAWIPDYATGKMRLFRIPTEADTLFLTVIRAPLEDMAEDGDEPEISPRFHEKLIHWMRYRCYSRHDADTFHEAAALKALALFEAEFGKQSAAQDEVFTHERYGQDDEEGLY